GAAGRLPRAGPPPRPLRGGERSAPPCRSARSRHPALPCPVGRAVSRVLLTGASTGIGNATLRRLVAEGHRVTTLDINDWPEGAAGHFAGDRSEPASIDAVVEQLDGPFDALGNIAGVAGSMGAELVLRVNVYGLRYLTEHLVAKGAITTGGSIVN